MRHTDGTCPHTNGCGYSVLAVDGAMMSPMSPSPVVYGRGGIVATESEGGGYASCAGCNANNGNAGRYLNANNAATNTNDNFAGGFANMTGHSTSQPARLKIEGNCIANGGCGQNDYGSLPYWGDNAESDAHSSIWDELEKANKRRKLKGLRRFYLSREIAEYAVRRTCKSRDTKSKRYYYDHAHNGSFEIKEACDLWLETDMKPPIYVTVRKESNSYYFEQWHVTNKEACEMIVEQMNIKL